MAEGIGGINATINLFILLNMTQLASSISNDSNPIIQQD
jgi:hypothetical protein